MGKPFFLSHVKDSVAVFIDNECQNKTRNIITLNPKNTSAWN